MAEFSTDLVGERIELRLPVPDRDNNATYRTIMRLVARGRVRAVTTRSDVLMLWIEIERSEDALAIGISNDAIGEVWEVATDRGTGTGIIKILKEPDAAT